MGRMPNQCLIMISFSCSEVLEMEKLQSFLYFDVHVSHYCSACIKYIACVLVQFLQLMIMKHWKLLLVSNNDIYSKSDKNMFIVAWGMFRVSPTAIWLLSHAFWYLYTVLPFHTLSITNASYYSTCTVRQRKNVGNTHWQPIMHIIQSVINYMNQSSWNR